LNRKRKYFEFCKLTEELNYAKSEDDEDFEGSQEIEQKEEEIEQVPSEKVEEGIEQELPEESNKEVHEEIIDAGPEENVETIPVENVETGLAEDIETGPIEVEHNEGRMEEENVENQPESITHQEQSNNEHPQ